MEFESSDVEKNFPGLYASESIWEEEQRKRLYVFYSITHEIR